jgi:LAO/AO transport system kinase
MTEVPQLAASILAGDRRALARAITLVESTRPDHRADASALLDAVMASTGRSHRVGISGAPGAGKSTFIEALGLHLVGLGNRVAVLAIDPSSQVSGGSILGDKTRMEELSRDPNAYIRPSPSRGTLGGVARRTREAMLMCEAAGFDVVIVETVGVGQSEVAVAGMVDLFALVLSPAAGDDLQGVKRGIVEIADLIVVNKCDGDLEAAAMRTAADYANAAHFLRARSQAWTARVLRVSALMRQGIGEVWSGVLEHHAALMASGELARRRADQNGQWMWSEINEGLIEFVRSDASTARRIDELEQLVRVGAISPTAAAQQVLGAIVTRG